MVSMRTEPLWLMQILGLIAAWAAGQGIDLTTEQLLSVVTVIQAIVVYVARKRVTSEATLANMQR